MLFWRKNLQKYYSVLSLFPVATAARYPASIVVPTMMNIDQPKESSNEVTMMSERNTVKNITPVIMF